MKVISICIRGVFRTVYVTYPYERSFDPSSITKAQITIATIRAMMLITRQVRIMRAGLPEPVPHAW